MARSSQVESLMLGRCHALVSPLAAAIVAATSVVGCYGDMVSTQEVVAGQEGGPVGDPIPTDLEFPCADPVETTDDGYHFEGAACLGCHNGTIGPAFSLGGTLYGADGAPLSGFNIHFIDADGAEHQLVTALNGNFYTDQPLALPGVAYVSACPDNLPMPVYAETGDCNGCHNPTNPLTFAP